VRRLALTPALALLRCFIVLCALLWTPPVSPGPVRVFNPQNTYVMVHPEYAYSSALLWADLPL
jgi:hypothetical protein